MAAIAWTQRHRISSRSKHGLRLAPAQCLCDKRLMHDEGRKQKLAEDRAALYAPAPTGGSMMAGVCSGVVALLGVFVISGFYGLHVRDHLILAAGLTCAGFLTGLIGYKRLARTNRRATSAERKMIDSPP